MTFTSNFSSFSVIEMKCLKVCEKSFKKVLFIVFEFWLITICIRFCYKINLAKKKKQFNVHFAMIWTDCNSVMLVFLLLDVIVIVCWNIAFSTFCMNEHSIDQLVSREFYRLWSKKKKKRDMIDLNWDFFCSIKFSFWSVILKMM